MLNGTAIAASRAPVALLENHQQADGSIRDSQGARPLHGLRPDRMSDALVLGTAGHIDHGKTALVRALTGDRLRSAARGEGARDHDRARLRAARAAVGTAALGDRRAGTRAARTHDGVRSDRHRPGAVRGRRRRGHHAAEPRASGDLRPARDRARRRRADQGRRWSSQDLLELAQLEVAEELERSCLAGAPIVPVSALTGRGLDALREALEGVARARRRAPCATARPGCRWTARSRCAASAPSSPARCAARRSKRA